MRRNSMVATAVILVLLSAGIARLSRPQRDCTTTSARAYKLLRQGETDLRAYRWEQARQELEAAVRLDPNCAMSYAALAEACTALGRVAQADSAVAAAESLTLRLPADEERWIVQLRLANINQRFLAQRDSLIALLEARNPQSIYVPLGRAYAAQTRLDPVAEEAAWQEVLRLDPNYAGAYNLLGYLADNNGRYEEARSYLKRYAFVAPDLANPHDSLGEILMHTGDYAEAEQEFLHALRIQKDFFPSLLNLALLNIEQGRLVRGVEILEKVRALMTGTDWEKRVDAVLVGTYYDYNLRPQLLTAIRRWIASYPADPGTPLYQAYERALDGKEAEARAALVAYLERARRDPVYAASPARQQQVEVARYSFEACLAQEAGDGPAAAAAYERALAADPQAPPHRAWSRRLRYGQVLERMGRHAEALAQARQILAVNPLRINALVLETRAALALSQTAEAREALGRLQSALALADRDLPAVAAADSLAATLVSQPPS